MESKETAGEAIAESLSETVEPVKATPLITPASEVIVPMISASEEPAQSTKDPIPNTEPAIEQVTQVTNDAWQQVTQIWEEYFGEGKKSNLTIAIAAIAIIPVLIITSALLSFLNRLPLLPSVFELVGFGYSGWFVYRYLLLANTRQELTDAINAWKNKVFG